MSGEGDLRARLTALADEAEANPSARYIHPSRIRALLPAEPARESDGVGLRLTEGENAWVTVLWDRNGRRGRLAEAKRDLEQMIAARVAEAGARALEASHCAADELDEWDGEASSGLGGCSPGGVVRHAAHEAAGVDIDNCPACAKRTDQ